jgi:hypothetical protein
MTYSNRPTASPYQHRNEFAKGNDAVLMNKINTFIVGDQMSLPGAWSNPYPFESHSSHKESASELSSEEQSPICDGHISAGDNTIALCKPSPPNCPMSRYLEPQRDINPGMWYYNKLEQGLDGIVNRIPKSCSSSTNNILLLLLFIAFVIIMFSKS